MKNTIKILIILSISILMFSCSRNNKNSEIEKYEEELEHESKSELKEKAELKDERFKK